MIRRTVLFVALLLLPVAAFAADYFIDSDDYKEGEEIVNKFLKEPDYRLMVEDIGRNGEEFDWGWVKVPAAAAAETPQPEGGRAKRMMGKLRRGGPNPAAPKELGFDLASYKTVAIPKVENYSGVVPKGLQDEVREAFVEAMKELGLTVIKDEKKADLLLELAIVDMKRDSTYIYFGNVQPFIELELRLRDQKANENLMLIRNQAHSNTPADAAGNYANTLVKFLR